MENLSKLNNKSPFLSISLLTSNRKDTIRKCLDSLTHLRSTIPSELIIVDTGCDDEMLQIIGEYTDRIIKYTWIKDFSDARNVQIQSAKGKWFLYIDDDEWFEDTKEIEDFFTSDRWTKVDACWYLQRNYQDFEGRAFSDDLVSRMFALIPGIHFEGAIHEYFTPFSGKFDIVHSYVHHYGYIFKSEKDRYDHSHRNLSLCLKMLQNEPRQMRWWLQIAQEYYVIGEYEILYEHCQKGLEQFKNDNDYFTNRDVAGFYATMLQIDSNIYNRPRLIKDAGTALSDNRLYPMARATIHFICMRDYAGTGEIDSAAGEAHKYLEYYDKYGHNEIAISEQTTYMVDETFSRRYSEVCYWIMIMHALNHKDLPMLKKYFDKVIWSTPELYIYAPNTIEDIVRFMSTVDYDEWMISAAERLLSRGDHIDKIIDCIRECEKSALNNPDTQIEFERLITIFSQISFMTPYIAYIKILALDMVEKNGTMLNNIYSEDIPSEADINNSISDFFIYICSSSDTFLLYKESFWQLLIKHKVDLNTAFSNADFDIWKKAVEKMCNAIY
ncbi:MAG: glycosyltransferase [Butyrivibrio sp.]|nr:glycosyltransferase [Butyrivibrio sp.]